MNLEIIREDDQVSYLAMMGRLGLAGVQDVEATFLAHSVERGVSTLVDISGLEYSASLGLRMFLGAYKSLKEQGCKLKLFRAQEPVRKAFESAGLNMLLAESSDLDGALKELAG